MTLAAILLGIGGVLALIVGFAVWVLDRSIMSEDDEY